VLELRADRASQALHAQARLVHGLHILLEGDLLRRVGKLQLRDPAPVRLGPGRSSGVADLVSQKQRLQPLARLALHAHGVLAGAHEIPERFIRGIGDIDGLELTRPGKARELQRIAPIGLHPLARLARRHGRRHDHAGKTLRAQAPVDPETARARLVNEHQAPMHRPKLPHRTVKGNGLAANAPVVAHLSLISDREIDRVLVHVHAHKRSARLFHGLPPRMVVDALVLNMWLYALTRVIHDTPEAGRLSALSHSV
jgi:hypothetical protein